MKSVFFTSVSLFALLAFPLEAAAPAKQKDPVVASVNGRNITLSDVMKLKKSLPEKYQSLPAEKLLPLLVRELIDTSLIEVAAEAAAKSPTEEQKKALEKAWAQTRKDVNSQFYLADAVKKELTDAKVEAAYKEMKEKFPPTEERKISHIVVKDKATAQGIIKALKNNGQDFQKLAKAKSTDASAQRGGMLGFVRKDELPEELGTTLFAQEVGSYSAEPVQVQDNWHVFKVDAKRQAEPPTFEEAKRTIEDKMTQDIITKLLEGLRSKAKITLYDKDGKPLPEKAAEVKEKGKK